MLAAGVLGGYYTAEDLEMLGYAAAKGVPLRDLVDVLTARGDAQV